MPYLFVTADGKVDLFNDTGGYGCTPTEDFERTYFHGEGGGDSAEEAGTGFGIEHAPTVRAR